MCNTISCLTSTVPCSIMRGRATVHTAWCHTVRGCATFQLERCHAVRCRLVSRGAGGTAPGVDRRDRPRDDNTRCGHLSFTSGPALEPFGRDLRTDGVYRGVHECTGVYRGVQVRWRWLPTVQTSQNFQCSCSTSKVSVTRTNASRAALPLGPRVACENTPGHSDTEVAFARWPPTHARPPPAHARPRRSRNL